VKLGSEEEEMIEEDRGRRGETANSGRSFSPTLCLSLDDRRSRSREERNGEI